MLTMAARKKHIPPFSNPEKAAEAGRLGALKRWGKRDEGTDRELGAGRTDRARLGDGIANLRDVEILDMAAQAVLCLVRLFSANAPALFYPPKGAMTGSEDVEKVGSQGAANGRFQCPTGERGVGRGKAPVREFGSC